MLRILFLSVASSVCVTTAMAQPIDSYSARLSERDHYNSSGTLLNSAPAIIRQDRANFYTFGKIDPEDESDSFFSDKANRARLEKMLFRGTLSDNHLDTIVNGTPLIRVDIFSDHVEITIIAQ